MNAPLQILVVSDDATLRRITALLNQQEDRAVTETSAVKESTSPAEDGAPDVILLDVSRLDAVGVEIASTWEGMFAPHNGGGLNDPQDIELTVIDDADAERALSVTVTHSATDDSPALYVWLDIGKHAQVDIRRQFHAEILENVRESIIVTDTDWTIQYWNSGATAIFGYEADEMIGKTPALLYPETANDRLASDMQQITKDGEFHGEWKGRRKDGSTVWLDIRTTSMRDADGRLIGFLGVGKDITASKRAHAELERLFEERTAALVKTVERLETEKLASSLAHELNQPLTAILSNAQAAHRLLVTDASDLEDVRVILADIIRDSRHAGEVIHRLRRLLWQGDIQRQVLNINEIVEEALASIESEAASHYVTLTLKLGSNLPPVTGDRIQLQQVVLNLARNAIEAMRHANAGIRELTVRTARSGSDRVEVAVTDTGPGLDTAALDAVFEPFYTTKPAGIGMGLAISRTIVQAHDGRLWATQNRDGGATFHLMLPTVDKPAL